jgi:hypothetical protein
MCPQEVPGTAELQGLRFSPQYADDDWNVLHEVFAVDHVSKMSAHRGRGREREREKERFNIVIFF